MAKWNFGLASKDSAINTKIDYSDNNYIDFVMEQTNVDKIMEEVKRDKHLLDNASRKERTGGWRKAFTVPDIVAMEIMQNHGINLHADETMKDPTIMKRFKYIIQTEYPHLLIST